MLMLSCISVGWDTLNISGLDVSYMALDFSIINKREERCEIPCSGKVVLFKKF